MARKHAIVIATLDMWLDYPADTHITERRNRTDDGYITSTEMEFKDKHGRTIEIIARVKGDK
jgi:hypothetical protein